MAKSNKKKEKSKNSDNESESNSGDKLKIHHKKEWKKKMKSLLQRMLGLVGEDQFKDYEKKIDEKIETHKNAFDKFVAEVRDDLKKLENNLDPEVNRKVYNEFTEEVKGNLKLFQKDLKSKMDRKEFEGWVKENEIACAATEEKIEGWMKENELICAEAKKKLQEGETSRDLMKKHLSNFKNDMSRRIDNLRMELNAVSSTVGDLQKVGVDNKKDIGRIDSKLTTVSALESSIHKTEQGIAEERFQRQQSYRRLFENIDTLSSQYDQLVLMFGIEVEGNM